MLRTCGLALACTLIACGSGTSTPPGIQLCPPIAYSGIVPPSMLDPMPVKWDVPLLVLRGGSTVTWATDNINVATADGNAMLGTITSVGAGMANVIAVGSDKSSYSVPVTVKMYPADSHLKGQNIYEAGLPLTGQDPNTKYTCSTCHDSPGQSNVTSGGVSDKTDDEVIAAFTMGKKAASEGGGMLNVQNHTFPHTFAITGDDQVNLVAFLRSQSGRGRPPAMDTCR
jgi:hypothetical protein